MSEVNSVIKSLSKLNKYEQEQIYNYLEQELVLGSMTNEIQNEIKENRFSSGKICPHCKKDKVLRNGTYNDKQRYICKNCKRTFTDFTLSPCYNSKKKFTVWLTYIKCMIAGYSIRKCAEITKISVPTSFLWRHKILDAIRVYIGIGHVSEVVEADETFFRLSYKGNHSKNPEFNIPRKSYRRGPKSRPSYQEEKKKRGISANQVSVMCATDRVGNIISELICNGRMRHTDVERFFKDRIEDTSILCVDSHKSYIKFKNNFNIEMQQIESGKYKQGLYHIQHINAYHSRLKKFMVRFHGVATKYLANYMYWFKWIELFKTEKDIIRCKRLLVQSHSAYSATQIKDFKSREAIYV